MNIFIGIFLTSHAIQCLSLKPIARAPLDIRGIQNALTQLMGNMIDHLKYDKEMHCYY